MSGPVDYQIGYGRPPVHSQFRKGRSGNPKGRPRGSRALADIWRRVWNEKVTVSENGRRRRITKQEAAIKQLVNKAAGGDNRATEAMIRFDAMLCPDTPPTPADTASEGGPAKVDNHKIALALLHILRGAVPKDVPP